MRLVTLLILAAALGQNEEDAATLDEVEAVLEKAIVEQVESETIIVNEDTAKIEK